MSKEGNKVFAPHKHVSQFDNDVEVQDTVKPRKQEHIKIRTCGLIL